MQLGPRAGGAVVSDEHWKVVCAVVQTCSFALPAVVRHEVCCVLFVIFEQHVLSAWHCGPGPVAFVPASEGGAFVGWGVVLVVDGGGGGVFFFVDVGVVEVGAVLLGAGGWSR